MKTYYAYMESPVGRLVMTSDGEALTALQMTDSKYPVAIGKDWIEEVDAKSFDETRRQLAEYFAGQLTDFDIPLAPHGTAFQMSVWRELQKIGYGTTATYGEIPRRLGNPNAMRAVGLANAQNPIAIIVPCHRVIGANGTLTGYAGGLAMKKALLDLETSGAGLFATR
jgi:methylated-DNA-[protein]-cysteine S-methyltransferase